MAHGPNILREAGSIRPWKLFLAQFSSLIVWLLIVAGIVSGVLGEIADAVAILAIVVLNAVIGFYQEYSAEKSIAALKKLTAPQAKVRREDRVRLVPAAEIVRGDVVEFESGDLIPADARLLEAANVRCSEAALTGESEAVLKTGETLSEAELSLGDRVNMVYMGTSVAAGAGKAVVVATGMATEIGKIAGMLETAQEDVSPLQKSLADFGRFLVWISLGLIALLFILGLLRDMPLFELFLTSISLAVAAVPEGLPAVVTVALALGVQRMARRNALIRRLPAVETLGSAGVICTDKTGTLTLGEMTVRELFVAGKSFQVEGAGLEPVGRILREGREPGNRELACLRCLAWAQAGTVTATLSRTAEKWSVIGDPTEGAMLSAAAKLGITPEGFGKDGKIFEFPFDSDRKRASVIRHLPGLGFHALVNGAPDILLSLCTHVLTEDGMQPLDAQWKARIQAANADMAKRALRVLGTALKPWQESLDSRPEVEAVENDLIFAGLTGMYDPPRPEAARAIALCRKAGIRVVMITGDHPSTALAVARELGLAAPDDGVLAGRELDQMDEDGLKQAVTRIGVYARVTAEHKLRIVRAWRSQGAVVAMTGDGVNDAPALKGSDIGVAMGVTGTEVTKQASDMVVTDDNFASIVAAVEEGRGIYANIRKTMIFLLAGNAGEMVLMLGAVLAGLPAPLLPIHLLWINLVTDGLPALCLAAEPVDPGVMGRKPRPRLERLANPEFIRSLLICGALTAGTSLAVYIYTLKAYDLATARSYAFATLVFCELFRAFGARSETLPVWRLNPLGNLKLLVVVTVSIGLQILSHHNAVLGGFLETAPLPLRDCLTLLAVSIIPFAVLEILKVVQGPRQGKA
jgi:Ca2+-transporting ATPase